MAGDESKRVSVLLSVQRALLGEVSSRLRAVRVSYDETNIRIVASFDGKITEADRESMSEVETEVYADFHQDRTVTVAESPAALPAVPVKSKELLYVVLAAETSESAGPVPSSQRRTSSSVSASSTRTPALSIRS